MAYRAAKTVVALLAVAPLASAHSWVEFLRRINPDGSFSKSTGYPIPYIARGAPGYSDDAMLNKILDKTSNPPVCKPGNFEYSQDAPRLSAAGGDFIAMQYQENGHVTQPGITQRPFRGGNVYVYGTLKKVGSTGINDVLYSWDAEGNGGDKRGKLLATHFFDDGQCYQNLGGVEPDPQANIYTNRRKKYGFDAVDCQTDFQLPSDLPENGIYNVMWVWDWPLITSDHTNVTETYTSCAQIQLKPKKAASPARINVSADHNVTNAAIQSQVHNLIEAVTLGQGTNSPPPPTGIATSTADAPETTTATGPATVTVTVSADPVTTTVYHTVTVGSGANPTDSQPGFPTFPIELPTDLPILAPSASQTSKKSSSYASSSSTRAAASPSTTTDDGALPGFPTATPETSKTRSPVTSSAAAGPSSSDDGPLPGFPTPSHSASAIGVTSSVESIPTPGFPPRPSSVTGSTPSSTPTSSVIPSTFLTRTRTASSSAVVEETTSGAASTPTGAPDVPPTVTGFLRFL